MSYALHENRILDARYGTQMNSDLMMYKISGPVEMPEIVTVAFDVPEVHANSHRRYRRYRFLHATLALGDGTYLRFFTTLSADELAPHLASHMDVNAIVCTDADEQASRDIQTEAARNIKRVVSHARVKWSSDAAQGPYLIKETQETKTTWHPIGN